MPRPSTVPHPVSTSRPATSNTQRRTSFSPASLRGADRRLCFSIYLTPVQVPDWRIRLSCALCTQFHLRRVLGSHSPACGRGRLLGLGLARSIGASHPRRGRSVSRTSIPTATMQRPCRLELLGAGCVVAQLQERGKGRHRAASDGPLGVAHLRKRHPGYEILLMSLEWRWRRGS